MNGKLRNALLFWPKNGNWIEKVLYQYFWCLAHYHHWLNFDDDENRKINSDTNQNQSNECLHRLDFWSVQFQCDTQIMFQMQIICTIWIWKTRFRFGVFCCGKLRKLLWFFYYDPPLIVFFFFGFKISVYFENNHTQQQHCPSSLLPRLIECSCNLFFFFSFLLLFSTIDGLQHGV